MEGSTYQLRTSDGTGNRGLATWAVTVQPGPPGEVVRQVSLDGEKWAAGWHPERTIWPTWSPSVGAESGTGASLQGAHDYWHDAGDRLRDSAKWLAAVIGASLGALVGTSPLADIWQHRLAPAAYAVGGAGIALLGVTLLLVLQVIRPVSVSFDDVQTATRGPLRTWRERVEQEQDLYLPFGVNGLTSLRQSMIIEEVTLGALALAAADGELPKPLVKVSQRARAARLKELREAAARVATIGEFYRVRRRSTYATFAGLPLGLAGTIAVVVAFAWPRG